MNWSNLSLVSSDDIVFSATNSASALVCLMAAILVFTLKLYKRVVYRLALYQVLSALAIASVELSQMFMVNYKDDPRLYERVCVAIGCLSMYTLWMKLLFTMWVSFHLFSLAVFGKNLKNLEVLYVVTSLLVPSIIAIVPMITHSYGFSNIDGCFIPAYSDKLNGTLFIAAIERFSLVEGPALLILLASSFVMIVMMIKLSHRFCRGRKYGKYEEISDFYRVQWAALKQLLPLAAFPVLFFIFIIPFSVFDIYYTFITPTPDYGLVLIAYLSTSLWTMSSGVTLLIHITIVRLPPFCRALSARTDINNSLGSATTTRTPVKCNEMESSTTQAQVLD